MKNDQRPCSVNPPGQGGTLELIDETLRDGTQSLWGMMMGYHMIEPVIGEIAEAGFSTVRYPGSFWCAHAQYALLQRRPQVHVCHGQGEDEEYQV